MPVKDSTVYKVFESGGSGIGSNAGEQSDTTVGSDSPIQASPTFLTKRERLQQIAADLSRDLPKEGPLIATAAMSRESLYEDS